jgi:hypothetical protein
VYVIQSAHLRAPINFPAELCAKIDIGIDDELASGLLKTD